MMIACVYHTRTCFATGYRPSKEETENIWKSANTASGSGNRYSIQRENAWSRAYGATPLSAHCSMRPHQSIVRPASAPRAAMPYGAIPPVLPCLAR